MKKQPPTYDNDQDLRELLYTDLTDEKLLKFIFKKGGKVNVHSLSYAIREYSKKEIAQNLVNLETAGLIWHKGWTDTRVTFKARWERFRDSKNVWWLIGILGLIGTFLAIILSR